MSVNSLPTPQVASGVCQCVSEFFAYSTSSMVLAEDAAGVLKINVR